MTIKEIVLETQDSTGELSRIIAHLYENDINVSAFSAQTDGAQAVFRLITSDPDSALSVLSGLNLNITTAEAIAVQIPDHPGGLNSVLKILSNANISIHHIYPCLNTGATVLILNLDEPEKAVKALKENWIKTYDDRLYKL